MYLTERVTTVFGLTSFFPVFSFFKQQMVSQWWWVHIFPTAIKLCSKELKCYGKVFHVSFKLPRATRVILFFRSTISGV